MNDALLYSLILVLCILLLYAFSCAFASRPDLKTNSIVIIDHNGQQIVGENEFIKFMNKLENLLMNNRHQHGKSKYVDCAADELKTWIRDNDHQPHVITEMLKDPLAEEIENMGGESNPILFDNNDQKNKSFDGMHISKEEKSTMNDLANFIKQIKEINLQYPDNERRSVNLTETYKLILTLLKNYRDDIEDLPISKMVNTTTVQSIQELFSSSDMPINKCGATAKMKKNKTERVTVATDVEQYNDRMAPSITENEQNSAIENMILKKSICHAKLTGGRKHILL